MRVLVTGSSGRIGRAICLELMRHASVVGADLVPSSTTDIVGDLLDPQVLARGLDGVTKIVHAAALHAPHVDAVPDSLFEKVNVELTQRLFDEGIRRRVDHFVFTSTTALYGYASTPTGAAGWITECSVPEPRTIYHRTKIEAEAALERAALRTGVPVTVIQMSRCFPEPADLMALYRLNRGVDARDVADAHCLALRMRIDGFCRLVVSASTPFRREDCEQLFTDAPAVVRRRAPELSAEFARRGWPLPPRIDRVYDASTTRRRLGWSPRHGFEAVLQMLDSGSPEVLPARLSPGDGLVDADPAV